MCVHSRVVPTGQGAVKDIHGGEVHPPLEIVQGQGDVLRVGLHTEREGTGGERVRSMDKLAIQCPYTDIGMHIHTHICTYVYAYVHAIGLLLTLG